MDIDTSIEQAAGIMLREELHFATSRDGRSYRLLFGSAAVFVNFDRWLEESVAIIVSSPIVQGIDPESPGGAQAFNLVNHLNATHYFVKFTFQHGILSARYDLLGDNLQAAELRNAIYAVASAANRLDDDLAEQLGGKAYETVMEEWSVEESDEE